MFNTPASILHIDIAIATHFQTKVHQSGKHHERNLGRYKPPQEGGG